MKETCDEEEFRPEIEDRRNLTPTGEVCETITEKKIPDELREPTPEALPSSEVLTPKPITIYNVGIRLICTTPGTEGEEVMVEDKFFSTQLYFSTVLSLTDDVLTYIAKNHLEGNIEAGVHNRTLTPKMLRTLTGMTLKQAQEFLDEAYRLQDQQDEYARAYGETQLECLYWNQEVTEECTDDKMAHFHDDPEAVFSATVQAHMFSSAESQEDADRQAREHARSLLVCFYVNEPVEVDCLTWPERPVNYPEPIPNDEEPIYPGAPLRVGHVRIESGMYRSYESLEAANELARQAAYGMLSCWYPNDPVHLECEDPNARGYGLDPAVTPRKEADIETGERGQIVDIPYGYYRSEISPSDATERAQQLAESLLECCFVSAAFTVRCEPQEVTYPDGHKEWVEPEKDRGVYEVYSKVGAATSCNSQEEADMLARQQTEGMLECIYCNGLLLPTCVPDWVIEGVQKPEDDPGHIPLPLSGIISDGKHTMTLLDLPPEATLGAAPKTFCYMDAQIAVNIADAAAGVPTIGSAECLYMNDAVYATCAGVDPITGEEHEANKIHYLVHPETGEAYIFYTMYPSKACLYYDQTRPTKGEYTVVPAGMFIMPGAEKKEECNRKAIDLALSMLYCVWANPKTKGVCDQDSWAYTCCDFNWTVGKGEEVNRNQVVEWANTSHNPIVLPEGYVQYIGTGEEGEDPFAILWDTVREYITPMIICIYTNELQQADCNDLPEGPVREEVLDSCGSIKMVRNGSGGVVEPNTVYAENPEEANAIALELARSMASCDINTVILWCESFFMPEPPVPPNPSPTPSPTPFDHWVPKPVPPKGSDSVPNTPEDCCYPDCPYYRQKKAINATRIITDISALESTSEKVIPNSVSLLQELENKAKILENYMNTLLKKLEKE